MGNFVSRFFKSKKEEGLGLEDYRKLVNDSGFRKVEPGRLGLRTVEEISPISPISPDLPDLDAKQVKVLHRKVDDASRVVKGSIEVREEIVRLNKGPIYRDLLDKIRRQDSTLSSVAFEVKLTEEKLSGIRLIAKLQEKKPKEVTLVGSVLIFGLMFELMCLSHALLCFIDAARFCNEWT